MTNRLTWVLALALLAGCTGKAAVAPVANQPEGVVTNRFPVHYASLQGVAQAPGTLLANNSSGLVSNNSSGVVSNAGAAVVANHGGMFTLADAETWQAVPAAQVVALDARRQPIPGVKATVTDGSGHFTLENVPSNVVVTVQVTAGSVTLTGLAKADGTRAQVNPATTVATEHIRERFEGNEAALSHVPMEQFRQLTIAVQNVLQTEGVKVPLATPEDAGDGFDALAKDHPELREQEHAVAKSASQELAKAVKDGSEATPKPEPQPSVAPTSAATPPLASQAPTSAGTPTPKPSATPSPGATNNQGEPTPKPSTAPSTAPTSNPSTPLAGDAALSQLLSGAHSCPSCDLTNEDAYSKDLKGADLHGATLVGIDVHRTHFENANFAGADLTGADLHGAYLGGANLRGAKLTNADLHEADLKGADLTGATLDGADLDLERAKLTGAIWTDGSTCAADSNGTCKH